MATVGERAVAASFAGPRPREHGTAREWCCDSTRGTRARPRDHAADFAERAQPVPNVRVPRPKAECPNAERPRPICPMPNAHMPLGQWTQLLQPRRRRRRRRRRRSAGSGGRGGRRNGAAHRNGGKERRSSSSSSSSRPALRCRLPGSSAVQDARAPGGCDAAACVAARTRASTSARAVGRCPTHDLPQPWRSASRTLDIAVALA